MPTWTKEQSEAIYKSGSNIIVSAGAGSGKTAVLSERVLEKLKSGEDIDSLLILTFTNAASLEMKSRIRDKVRKIDSLKEQLDKIDLASITTFDAYSLSIVKKYSHYLNISSSINIIDNSIITLKKIELLNEIFENLYKNQNSKFLKLINDFCLKDDKEIFNAIISLNSKLDNYYNKKEILNTYIQSFYTEENIEKFIKEYENILLNKITSIKRQVDNISIYTDGSFIEKLEEKLINLYNANDYMSIKYALLGIDRLPVLRGASEEAKVIKEEINKLIKELKNLVNYEKREDIKNSILNTHDYVEIIIDIIRLLDDKVNEYKKKNNSYEFVDIAIMAINLLKDNESVRNELRDKYHEILIDEYQDTNDIQDLFISLIANNNVYMVGDVKQSIYRFRNANPMIFKEKYENYSKNISGYKIDLNKNFRSRSEVLDNINLIFNLIMDSKIGGADYISSHQMFFGLTPYNDNNLENYNMKILNYELPEDKVFSKEEIEIFTIANDIKNKINNHYQIMDKDTMKNRDIRYEDFVILMDRSSSFALYKKIFEYLNIPLTIYRDKTISDSIDITLIKNIYNMIIKIDKKEYDTSFNYSFMSIARSYLFNMNDNDIFRIITNKDYKNSEIYNKCYSLSLKLDELNNKELFENIIDEFNFLEKSITDKNILEHSITIDSISKIVDNTSSFGYGPIEFLDYLNMVSEAGLSINLSLNKESGNAVKIMTIHTSKGLEYPICYFSGLYKTFNIDDLKNKFYYDNTYGFIVPYNKDGIKTTILKQLLKNKYMEDEISEKLRLFYVGLTRAREEMILVGNFEKNNLAYKDNGIINDEARLSIRSFKDIIEVVYDNISKYIVNVDITNIDMVKDYNYAKFRDYKELYEKGHEIDVKEYSYKNDIIDTNRFSKNVHKLLSKEEKNNMEFGKEMHYLFEITDFKNPDYSGMSEFQKKCIEKFIDNEILKEYINLYKEYEFMIINDSEKRNGIIDLLIEKEDEFIIVDYKLNNVLDDAYKAQLSGYKKYIESISDKKVSTYLYSIIDTKLLKID